MRIVFSLLIVLVLSEANAQNKNSVWCFGDSAGMDFSLGSPTLFISGVKSRGSCASISDSLHQLLFYGYTRATVPGNTTLVKNRIHNLMVNGNNVVGAGWYQELCIVPFPDDVDNYYLFSIGMTNSYGLYYSVIDMSLDSGRGSVTLKNVQLLSVQASDGINAVRHGNGRDWWLFFRRADAANDEYYEYLISPVGITGPFIIHAGSLVHGNLYRTCFAPGGDKLACVNTRGLVELLDFDRCSGNFTLNQTISAEFTSAPFPYYMGVAFSPSEDYLYVSAAGVSHPTYLVQYDLTAPDISLTADTLWIYSTTEEAGGHLKLAPDGKIYMACEYIDGTIDYPYADSSFNTVNNNLSVINYPDSLGVACDFQPFSFNLGAGRTYWGLPNNPDYELGPDTNSLCDTITDIGHLSLLNHELEMYVFYHSNWKKLFVNAKNVKGDICRLSLLDLSGREIYKARKRVQDSFFTMDVDVTGISKGMYMVSLFTDNDRVVKQIIIN